MCVYLCVWEVDLFLTEDIGCIYTTRCKRTKKQSPALTPGNVDWPMFTSGWAVSKPGWPCPTFHSIFDRDFCWAPCGVHLTVRCAITTFGSSLNICNHVEAGWQPSSMVFSKHDAEGIHCIPQNMAWESARCKGFCNRAAGLCGDWKEPKWCILLWCLWSVLPFGSGPWHGLSLEPCWGLCWRDLVGAVQKKRWDVS